VREGLKLSRNRLVGAGLQAEEALPPLDYATYDPTYAEELDDEAIAEKSRLQDSLAELEREECLESEQHGTRPKANAGAYDADAVIVGLSHVTLLGDEIQPAKHRDAYLGDSLQNLMRGPDSGKSGGGGSGSSRVKKPEKVEAKIAQPVPDDLREVNQHLLQFLVTGVTRGEYLHYYNRRTEARLVLAAYADRVWESGTVEPRAKFRAAHVARFRFHVYGLTYRQVEVLKLDPGCAARVLADHARIKPEDAARIARIEGR
jgi:hypothetical protein